MALYRVMIPYKEPGSGAHVRYATIEVEAESDPAARRVAVSEFGEMAVFSAEGSRPSVIESNVRVERASVSRRSAFEVTTTRIRAGVVSARLAGSLNTSNFHRLQETLDDLKAEGVMRLVLDLSGLTYINSTGLSLLVAAGDLFDLRLAAVPVKIYHILKMIGLDKLFPTFHRVSEAATAPATKESPRS